MPPMNRSRMTQWRERKKKTDLLDWEEHLRRDRERKKAKRGLEKTKRLADRKLQYEHREKERIRKRKQREKKKCTQVASSTRLGSYKSPNTLRKAVKKVKQSLPFSPSKKVAVIKEILRDSVKEGLAEVAEELFPAEKSRSGNRLISSHTIEKVLAFYESDTVSRQAPGKRDKKSVKDPVTGKRSLVQIRHMLVTIGEAFEMFKLENENSNISKSKFYKLRPENILPVSQMPHNVCVCKYHYNFSSIFCSIANQIQQPGFPSNYHELLHEMCCNTSKEKCMTNNCKRCKSDIFDLIPEEFHVDLNATIQWKEWNEVNERLTLLENTSSLENAIMKTNSLLLKFKTHCFVKKQQSLHFENLKKDLSENDLVVQFDFAENYSIIHQDEIQSAHWQHSQVAIFTCVVWGKNTTDLYAVVSDDLTHSKYSVWTFLKCIFDHHDLSGIEKIHVFTDNCAAQFKSRYVISNLCFLEDDLGLKLTWNHFAASHGKGAVDGVGGVVKGKVWIATKSRKVLVNSAKDFYKCATTECNKINILYTPKEDVEANRPLLDARFSRALEITGIQSYHSFWRADESHIYARQTAVSKETKIKVLQPSVRKRLRYSDVYSSDSSDEEWPTVHEEETVLETYNSDDIEEGDWVVVIYDGWFPGKYIYFNKIA